MVKLIVFVLSVLLSFSAAFSRPANNESIGSTEAALFEEEAIIYISFEHYKMHDGWTPVVLSIGELKCLLWMDKDGKVSELREPADLFIGSVCVIDLSNKSLRKEADVLHFDVYEQNNIRTRWRLSSKYMAETVPPKILFREKIGIELCLGTLRLQLKHAAWDIEEFSPGLYHVQFHGTMMAFSRPMVYAKAAGKLYSDHEWRHKLTHEQNQNRPQVAVLKASAAAAVPSLERATLIALYNSTNGDNWNNNSGWKTPPLAADGFALPGTENNWYGIGCDAGNTTVQRIELGGNNLDGILPLELGNLPNLEYLNLYGNQLSGIIHPEIGSLTNLKYLYLYENQLSGIIPPELGNLANLQELILWSNQLSGIIPPELGTLANLQYLDLDSNQLSGPIPAELGNLANLQILWLSSNQLNGIIPSELGSLANLQALDFYYNQLSGIIPPELGNLANLQWLDLGDNQLSGFIPQALGNLANLKYLWLNLNQLSGPIPIKLRNLADLQWLDLGDNQLSGFIPKALGNLANLKYLWLNSNQLSGSIPFNLANLGNLNENYGLELRWNALYTHDDKLRDFLNSKQYGKDWESSQTIAPSDVNANPVSISAIKIDWTPIVYTWDRGGYRVFYSTTPGGPYTYAGITTDKSISSFTITGLNLGVTYYFVVQTRTDPHGYNQNTVDSEYSAEVSAVTSPIILTSPNGGESWSLHTIRNITWTSGRLTGNIRLELWKADKKLGTIAAKIPINNGIYAWSVGNYGQGIALPGNDYKVKIITANGLYNDSSNKTFAILQPSLTLTSPRSNESLRLGTFTNIAWKSVGLKGNVKLLLFKNGVQVGMIARGIPITNGTYTWTVGKNSCGLAPTGSNYTVKIRSEGNPSYCSGCGIFNIL